MAKPNFQPKTIETQESKLTHVTIWLEQHHPLLLFLSEPCSAAWLFSQTNKDIPNFLILVYDGLRDLVDHIEYQEDPNNLKAIILLDKYLTREVWYAADVLHIRQI